MPNLATLASPVTVQLLNRANGRCWEATYSAPFLMQNGGEFLDRAD